MSDFANFLAQQSCNQFNGIGSFTEYQWMFIFMFPYILVARWLGDILVSWPGVSSPGLLPASSHLFRNDDLHHGLHLGNVGRRGKGHLDIVSDSHTVTFFILVTMKRSLIARKHSILLFCSMSLTISICLPFHDL